MKLAIESDRFFVQIAYLIFTNQFVELLPEFEKYFGKEWTKKYQAIMENHYYGEVYDLVL